MSFICIVHIFLENVRLGNIYNIYVNTAYTHTNPFFVISYD